MRKMLFLGLTAGLALGGGAVAIAHPTNVDLGDTAFTDNNGFVHSISFDCVPGESGGIRVTVTQEGGGKAKLKVSYTCPTGGSVAGDYGTLVAGPFVDGPALARGVVTTSDGGRATAREIITVDVV